MRQICRIAFIFHKFIHRQQLLNERFSGFFTGIFHKTSELSTISTKKLCTMWISIRFVLVKELKVF